MPLEVQDRSVTLASRRRVPRFLVQAPMDVTVTRAGILDTLPGRSVNLCEGGLGAVLAAEVAPGELVGVEVRLSGAAESLQARAVVKYQESLRCGLEFVGLSAEQRAAIRRWAKGSRAEIEANLRPAGTIQPKTTNPNSIKAFSGGTAPKSRKSRTTRWGILLAVTAVLLVVFWWQWNRGWRELDSEAKQSTTASTNKPKLQVPPDEMQRLLIHRVEPSYPAAARRAKQEGVIAVDMIVGPDGSVVTLRALNGPDSLAHAATNALRWWKFEPYRVDGKAVAVETTMAVEFKP